MEKYVKNMSIRELIEELTGPLPGKLKDPTPTEVAAEEEGVYEANRHYLIDDLWKDISPKRRRVIELASELGERLYKCDDCSIKSAEKAYALLKHWAMEAQEHFIAVALNGALKVLGTYVVSIGTVSRCLVHPREVFAPAIEKRASAIIVAHNHPSGQLKPSKEDYKITDDLLIAGSVLGIEVMDHMILTQDGYFSFKEKGLMRGMK